MRSLVSVMQTAMRHPLMPLIAVRLIALPLNLVALGIAARVMDPLSFGRLSVFIAAIGIGTVFYSFGLPRNLLRDIGEMRALAERHSTNTESGDIVARVLTQLLAFFSLLFAATVLISALAAPLLHGFSTWELIFYAAAGLLNALAVCLSEILRALSRFWAGALLSTIGMLALLSLVILLLSMAGVHDILIYAAIATATYFCAVAGGIIFLRLALQRPVLKSFKWTQFGQMLLISLPVFGMDLMTLATNQLDVVLVSSTFGLTEAGEYAKSVRIAALLGLLMTVLAAKVSPSIADFRVNDDIVGARTHTQRWTTLTFMAALPPALAMLVFGAEIGQLIFGSFAATAVPVLQALVFAQIINLSVGPASELLVMHGHRWAVFVIVTTSTGLGLGFMLLVAFVFDGSLLAFAWTVAGIIALTQLGYAAGLYAKEGYWSGLNLALFGLALRRLRQR